MAAAEAVLREGAIALGEKGESEWHRLLRQIQLAQGFWLGILFSPLARRSDELYARSCQHLALRGRRSIRMVMSSPGQMSEVLPLLLSREAMQAGMLWIEGRGPQQEDLWRSAWGELLLRSNERRDRLRRHIQGGLVLVLPPWARTMIREAASDLWSIRAIVLDVPGPPPESLFEAPLFDHRVSMEPDDVPRSIEPEIAACLLKGQRCIVVAPPWSGVDRLRERLTHRLQGEGVPCVTLEPGELCAVAGDPAEAGIALIRTLGAQLEWHDLLERWEAMDDAPTRVRFARCLAEGDRGCPSRPVMLLVARTEKLLDAPPWLVELIETLRASPRFIVCLLGAAFPARLGPQSVEHVSWLGDLSRMELDTLPSEHPWHRLSLRGRDRLLRWTGGQPDLTWRLLPRLAGRSVAQLMSVLRASYLLRYSRDSSEDKFLWGVRHAMNELEGPALTLYQQVLAEGAVPLRQGDPACQILWRSGIVSATVDGKTLRPRGRLLTTLFNQRWAEFQQISPVMTQTALCEDYAQAVLHLCWTRHKGEDMLLHGAVELLPDGVSPPSEDEGLVLSLSRRQVALRRFVLSVEEALRWYRACAGGHATLPGEPERRLRFDLRAEEPAWPALRSKSCYVSDLDGPLSVGRWAPIGRYHELRGADLPPEIAIETEDLALIRKSLAERDALRATGMSIFSQRHPPATLIFDDEMQTGSCASDWLGIIRLYAADPVVDRLDVTVSMPGQEESGIAYRIWPRPGRSVEGLELVFLVMPRAGGPRLVRRPILQEEGGFHIDPEDEVPGFAVCHRHRGPLCIVRAAGSCPGLS